MFSCDSFLWFIAQVRQQLHQALIFFIVLCSFAYPVKGRGTLEKLWMRRLCPEVKPWTFCIPLTEKLPLSHTLHHPFLKPWNEVNKQNYGRTWSIIRRDVNQRATIIFSSCLRYTKMTDFPPLSYSSTCKIPTIYIPEACKRCTFWVKATLYWTLRGVPFLSVHIPVLLWL